MKRTKFPTKIIIPDAINCSMYDESFTTVPNSILRNSKLSFKAKGIICLLLSNKEGWKTYLQTLQCFTKDGIETIKTGLKELEEIGYLIRVKYKDKKTKQWKGSFWAYTDIPFHFKIQRTLELLVNQGLEPEYDFISKDPGMGFPVMGNPEMGNQMVIILKENKTNKEDVVAASEKLNIEKHITSDMFEKFWKIYPKKVAKGQALSKWIQICGRKEKEKPTWIDIKKSIYKQIKTERWQDSTFIPNPTTWLNQRRWLDDPKQMTVPKFNTSQNNKPKSIMDPDLGKFILNEKDGKYYHCRSNQLYIP